MSSLFETMLFYYVIFLLFRTVVLQQEGSCTVVKDEPEARRCLNLTDDDTTTPLPINLTSHINGDFICNNTKPYYAFFCTLYGIDLIWVYNDQIVNTFQINDTVGRTYRRTYPEPPENPVHNITTVLTELDREAGEELNISVPFCISTLTVQPFDDDDFKVIPFTVSCQTHCSDANDTTICQTQQFNVAAKPKKPMNLTQNISRIAGNQRVPSAVASIDWDSSNDTDTTVVSYNLTLVNTKTFDTLYVSLHNSSFTEVVSDGSYNVSISAIDLCQQQSEPATLEFHVDAASLTAPCSNEEKLKTTVDGLAVTLALLSAALIVVIIVLSVCLARQYQKQSPNNVRGTTITYGSSQ